MKKYVYLLLMLCITSPLKGSDLQGITPTSPTRSLSIITHVSKAAVPHKILIIDPNRPLLVRRKAIWNLLSLLRSNAAPSSQTP